MTEFNRPTESDPTSDKKTNPACGQDTAIAAKRAAEQRWLEENRSALDALDEYIELNGLPLAKYRQF